MAAKVQALGMAAPVQEEKVKGGYLVQTLFLLLQLLQMLLHDLQPGLVLGLQPARLPQGLLPFLVLLG